jgi:hypothetical protein
VESAIYAQYPDSEITEVDDYTDQFKSVRFPNDVYEIMGAEFIQVQPKAYPIKTYEEFEHIMGEPETNFRDPMAALMDLCSSLRPGENLWYQMIVIPTGFDWVADLDKEVSKILGEKKKAGKNILHYGIDFIMSLISAFGSAIFGPVEESKKKEEKKDDALKMMSLKPKQKKRVEGIEKKSGKIAFNFKIRVVYLAEKEVFNKAKVFGGFVGFMKQFSAVDSNNLKPDMDRTATSAAYLFQRGHLIAKKNKIFKHYLSRDTTAGRLPGLFSVEELATIWHFPIEGVVKAPLIQKAPGRKAEPPMTLPQAEQIVGEEKVEPLFLGDLNDGADGVPERESEKEAVFAPEEDQMSDEEKGAPPENLPFI